METSVNSDLDCPRPIRGRRPRPAAFTLVEIALALGIMAFALVSVFGLLPLGMTSFRQAIDLSVGSQIAQKIIDEAQQADFNTLTGVGTVPTGSAAQVSKPLRYFDVQGSELFSNSASGLTGMVYVANTRVVTATAVPSTGSASGVNNGNLATVTVQVVNNPANQAITLTNGLWTSTVARPVTTFSMYVARSSSVPSTP